MDASKKIMPGLNAAFVDVGYEKDAFLHYLDLGPQIRSLNKYTKLALNGKPAQVTMDNFRLEQDIEKNRKNHAGISHGRSNFGSNC